MEGMRKRQFEVRYSFGWGYWVAEIHEGGFTSQLGPFFKKRESAERKLGVVLRNHKPQYVPTYAAMEEKIGLR